MRILEDTSQPPPFSPILIYILNAETKFYCFIVGNVPESIFNYL